MPKSNKDTNSGNNDATTVNIIEPAGERLAKYNTTSTRRAEKARYEKQVAFSEQREEAVCGDRNADEAEDDVAAKSLTDAGKETARDAVGNKKKDKGDE